MYITCIEPSPMRHKILSMLIRSIGALKNSFTSATMTFGYAVEHMEDDEDTEQAIPPWVELEYKVS